MESNGQREVVRVLRMVGGNERVQRFRKCLDGCLRKSWNTTCLPLIATRDPASRSART